MQTAIEFRNIKKAYGDKVVLEGFNLTVEKGEFVTIIGSSGCGKTTALKMVNGLIEPTEGDILVDGESIRGRDQTALRRNIGYAIQGSVLFPHMTVGQNISYVPNLLNRRDKAKTKAAVSRWMRIVGLDEELKDRYPDELSGGQQQRVGIARALAASPEILLMDEPFGAVDEITRGQLQKELRRIYEQTGITVLFVTHDIGEALLLGTKVLVMDRGTIQQYAPPAADSSVPDTFFSDLTLPQALEALQGTALFGGLAEAFAQAVDRGAESVAAGVIQALAEYAAVQLTRAVLFLVCFIAVLAAWTLLSRALDLAFRLPVLSTLNHWAGALMGLATGALVAVIALWLLGDFLPRQALADSVLLSLALRTDLAAFLPR